MLEFKATLYKSMEDPKIDFTSVCRLLFILFECQLVIELNNPSFKYSLNALIILLLSSQYFGLLVIFFAVVNFNFHQRYPIYIFPVFVHKNE